MAYRQQPSFSHSFNTIYPNQRQLYGYDGQQGYNQPGFVQQGFGQPGIPTQAWVEHAQPGGVERVTSQPASTIPNNAFEAMSFEDNSGNAVPEMSNTEDLFKVLDTIGPLLEKSKKEVESARSRPQSRNSSVQPKECERLQKQLSEAERAHKDAEGKLRDAEDKLARNKDDENKFKRETEQLMKERDMYKRVKEQLEASLDQYKLLVQQVRGEKKKVEMELEEATTRISKLIGTRLSDNNPDIADLSDMNRPTKIAERYSELYDNEWTDAFEEFNKSCNDETCIRNLLIILREINNQCDKMAEEQSKQLATILCLTEKLHDPSQVDARKQIKDLRKEAAPRALESVQKRILDDFLAKFPSGGVGDALRTDNVQRYMKKCTEICWYMSVQDPPLILGTYVKDNEDFSNVKYKPYTSTGEKVDYLVWPEMYLKEGALLCKGVAQGTGRVQSARERRRQNDTTDDEVQKRPQSAQPIWSVEDQSPSHKQQQDYGGSYQQDTVDAHNRESNSSSEHTQGHDVNAKNMYINLNENASLYNALKKESPPRGVSSTSWKSFLFDVKTYGLESTRTKSLVAANYAACKQHYIQLLQSDA